MAVCPICYVKWGAACWPYVSICPRHLSETNRARWKTNDFDWLEVFAAVEQHVPEITSEALEELQLRAVRARLMRAAFPLQVRP